MALSHEKITLNTRKNSYLIVVTRQRCLTDFFHMLPWFPKYHKQNYCRHHCFTSDNFVNVSNVSFGLQGGVGGDKYWKCQGIIILCSLTLNVCQLILKKRLFFPTLAGCVISFNCMTLPIKFEKIDNLVLLRSKAALVYISKNADGIPRVEFVAHFLLIVSRLLNPFLYQRGANNCS